MNKIGIFAISAACCIMLSSCGDSKLKYHDTAYSGFRYGVSSQLKAENDDPEPSRTGDVYKCKYGTITVGRDQGYYHVTAKGYGEANRLEYYKKNGYSDISDEELEFNGMPAYRVNATDADGISYSYTVIQYGNGELLSVEAESKGKMKKLMKQADIILDSVECSDPPLKTEAETVENDYFSITAGKDWYIENSNKKKDKVGIVLNLADEYRETLQRVTFEAYTDGPDAAALAQQSYEKKTSLQSISSLEIEDTEFIGFDAKLVSYDMILNSNYSMKHYYFENNNVCYLLYISALKDSEEEFLSDIQPILDSIKIK